MTKQQKMIRAIINSAEREQAQSPWHRGSRRAGFIETRNSATAKLRRA